MKKRQLKNYLKFGILLFGISILAIACEKDNFYDNHTEQNFDSEELIIKTITLKQAGEQLTELSSKFNVIQYFDIVKNNQNNTYQKNSENLDFIVNTKVVKEITFGDYTSYTMFLESLPAADSSFYNVTIENKNGMESMFITKYVPTQQWLNDKTQTFSGQVSSKRATELENPFDGNSGGIGGFDPFVDNCNGTVVEYTIWVPYACGCNHMPWDVCSGSSCGGSFLPGFQPETVYECIPDNSPPDGNTNPNDNGTGNNGGTPNDDTNTDEDDDSMSSLITEDEIDAIDDGKPKTKCQSLKVLTQTDSLGVNILPLVDSLRTKLNDTIEWSVAFKKKFVDGNMKGVPWDYGVREGISDARSYFRYGTRWFGQIHTHPLGRKPIFSWLDLKALKNIYYDAHEHFQDDVFLMIVNHDGSVYSLKIDDLQTLITALDADLAAAAGNDNDEKEDNIEEFLKEKYKKSTNLEKTFLELYGNHGISLYKATDSNLSNWKQLELNENDNETINETNCN
tara:strand:+ start:173 stop:1702 length:1530 start_codon:yes stop_codon:yes gene_type:complete